MYSLNELLYDRQRGSTLIFIDAIKLLLLKDSAASIKYYCKKLKDQFSAMGLFINLWISIRQKDNLEDIHLTLREVLKSLESILNKNIEYAGKSLPNDTTIITISHSSYIRKLIIHNKEKVNRVYCLESAPEFEGKELAKHLKETGIDASVLPDFNYQKQLKISTHVIVGSDLISKHFFINKSGTKELLEMAGGQDKNIWILGDELRFVSDYTPRNISDIFEVIPLRDEFRVFQ